MLVGLTSGASRPRVSMGNSRFEPPAPEGWSGEFGKGRVPRRGGVGKGLVPGRGADEVGKGWVPGRGAAAGAVETRK